MIAITFLPSAANSVNTSRNLPMAGCEVLGSCPLASTMANISCKLFSPSTHSVSPCLTSRGTTWQRGSSRKGVSSATAILSKTIWISFLTAHPPLIKLTYMLLFQADAFTICIYFIIFPALFPLIAQLAGLFSHFCKKTKYNPAFSTTACTFVEAQLQNSIANTVNDFNFLADLKKGKKKALTRRAK